MAERFVSRALSWGDNNREMKSSHQMSVCPHHHLPPAADVAADAADVAAADVTAADAAADVAAADVAAAFMVVSLSG